MIKCGLEIRSKPAALYVSDGEQNVPFYITVAKRLMWIQIRLTQTVPAIGISHPSQLLRWVHDQDRPSQPCPRPRLGVKELMVTNYKPNILEGRTQELAVLKFN